MSESSAANPFASLSNDRYLRLWLSGTASFMSVQMQMLVRGLLAWDLTGRESDLGTVYLCFGLGMLVATPLGGVAADRLPKQRVLVFAQVALTLNALVMGLLVLFDLVQFWHLALAALFQGVSFAFFGPARVAYSAEIVGRDQLANAITLSLLSMNGTRVFAPALAGVLAGVSLIGIGGVYLISAATSVVALLFLIGLPAKEPAPSGRNPIAELVDGVRYVAGIPRLRALVVLSLVTIMFGFNYVSFLPALIKGEFGYGDAEVGFASSASAVGAVAFSLVVATWGDGRWGHKMMIVGGLVFGAMVAAMGLATNLWTVYVVIAIAGAGTTTFQSLSNSIALGWSTDAYQGRVQSLMMLAFAAFGIAARPLGQLAERIGLGATLVWMGGLTVGACALYGLFYWSTPPAGLSAEEATDDPVAAGAG